MASELIVKREATVQTTDGTVTTCGTYTLADASAGLVIAYIAARRPSNGDSAAYIRIVGVKRHAAGGATLVGAVNGLVSQEDAGAALWDATLDVNSNDVRVRVTGAAATTIEWMAQLELRPFYVP